MIVGLVGYVIRVGDGLRRFRLRVARYVGSLARRGVELVVFPEYLGFEMPGGVSDTDEVVERAAALYDDYIELFRELSVRHSVYIAAGTTPEPLGRHYYNSLHLFTPDGGYLVYRKIHLHKIDKELGFRAGGEPVLADLGGLRVGLMVCYDLGFPELARIYGVRGAVGIVAPSMAPGRGAYMWLRYTAHSRAIEIQGFVALGAGRIEGAPLGFRSYGKPALLVTTDYKWDGVVSEGDVAVGEIDIDRLLDVRRRTAAPVLKDWRADLYIRYIRLGMRRPASSDSEGND